jgi:hypothetical protein
VESTSRHVDVIVLEGDDLKWLNAYCGMSGCYAECSCPWGIGTSDEYAKCRSSQMRDYVSMLKLAHAVLPGVLEAGYTCPCCEKVS